MGSEAGRAHRHPPRPEPLRELPACGNGPGSPRSRGKGSRAQRWPGRGRVPEKSPDGARREQRKLPPRGKGQCQGGASRLRGSQPCPHRTPPGPRAAAGPAERVEPRGDRKQERAEPSVPVHSLSSSLQGSGRRAAFWRAWASRGEDGQASTSDSLLTPSPCRAPAHSLLGAQPAAVPTSCPQGASSGLTGPSSVPRPPRPPLTGRGLRCAPRGLKAARISGNSRAAAGWRGHGPGTESLGVSLPVPELGALRDPQDGWLPGPARGWSLPWAPPWAPTLETQRVLGPLGRLEQADFLLPLPTSQPDALRVGPVGGCPSQRPSLPAPGGGGWWCSLPCRRPRPWKPTQEAGPASGSPRAPAGHADPGRNRLITQPLPEPLPEPLPAPLPAGRVHRGTGTEAAPCGPRTHARPRRAALPSTGSGDGARSRDCRHQLISWADGGRTGLGPSARPQPHGQDRPSRERAGAPPGTSQARGVCTGSPPPAATPPGSQRAAQPGGGGGEVSARARRSL